MLILEEHALDLLTAAGVNDQLKVSVKNYFLNVWHFFLVDVQAQSVIQHESLFKVSFLLDQFKEGLSKIGILPLITCVKKCSHSPETSTHKMFCHKC